MNAEKIKNKGAFEGVVISNEALGPRYHRVKTEFKGTAAKILANAIPGQFAEIRVSDLSLPETDSIPNQLKDVSVRQSILRRPFSFANIEQVDDSVRVDFLFCVLGPGTLRMSALKEGAKIEIIAPLGNGFWIPKGKKRAILVAGGMGAPPLQFLAKVLSANYPDVEVTAFAGAKTVNDLPFEVNGARLSLGETTALVEFAQYGIKSVISTDDGSAGFKGFITDCLKGWLDRTHIAATEAVIYSCGPEAMLKQLSLLAHQRGIDCQVSMEKMMACGIGLCQSCAVEVKTGEHFESVYKLCCKDGPIFDSKDIVW